MATPHGDQAAEAIRARHGVKFDGTINLGHVLTMIVMAGSGASMYFSLDKRIQRQEDLAPFVQSARDSTDARVQNQLVGLAADMREVKTSVETLTINVRVQNAVAARGGK